MPRVNIGKTKQQLAQEAAERQSKRVRTIIKTQLVRREMTVLELAQVINTPQGRLYRAMRGETDFDLITFCRIADALGFDDEMRAAAVGGKRCRFE